jgi:hypothetical protein
MVMHTFSYRTRMIQPFVYTEYISERYEMAEGMSYRKNQVPTNQSCLFAFPGYHQSIVKLVFINLFNLLFFSSEDEYNCTSQVCLQIIFTSKMNPK